jgi:hypothetical protein
MVESTSKSEYFCYSLVKHINIPLPKSPNPNFKQGGILDFLFSMYCIQHCFICRPSDSTVSEDAGIEPRNVANFGIGSQTL